MHYAKLFGLGLFFAANLAMAGTSAPKYYEENPLDAGDRHNPQNVNENLSTSPWSGFSGDIGGLDKFDAFRFYFAGGDFIGSMRFPDPDTVLTGEPGEGGSESDLVMRLYKDSDRDTAISLTGLAAGNYVVEFEYTGSIDPPFSFTLDDPFPRLISLPQAAPAPGALALVLAGLAGLGYSRRRATAA